MPVTNADVFFYVFWFFSFTFSVTNADVYLHAKKPGGENCRGELSRMAYWWRKMAAMKCARRHARGDQLQRCRQRVAFCLICILYMIVYKKNYFFQISVFLKELICETYFKIYSIGSYMLPKYIGLNNVKTLNHPLKSDRSRNMWMRFG